METDNNNKKTTSRNTSNKKEKKNTNKNNIKEELTLYSLLNISKTATKEEIVSKKK